MIAALLTATMILLFLGTWRNTLVVALSIPLSIFCSIICLYALGQTINAMTLGGLALAVGILVDDATVEIENIDRNLHMRKPLVKAILDGAQQIAVPAFVSTLCICIVFVPIFFLQGTAKFLFGPLAMAVIFAMLASYFLSRTVVPTFVHYLLLGKTVLFDDGHGELRRRATSSGASMSAFNRHFERFRSGYTALLERCLEPAQGRPARDDRRGRRLGAARDFFLGRDFFPVVDAGQFRLHLRAPDGTRIEATERYFSQAEDIIRQVVPAGELDTIIDNIGLPNGSTGLAFSDTATVGTVGRGDPGGLEARGARPDAGLRADDPGAPEPGDAQLHRSSPSPPTSWARSSTSGYRRRSTSRSPGRTAQPTTRSSRRSRRGSPRSPARWTCTCTRSSTPPRSRSRSTARGPRSSGSPRRRWRATSSSRSRGTGQVAPNYWLSPQGVQYFVEAQTPQYQIDSHRGAQGTPDRRRRAPEHPGDPGQRRHGRAVA